MAALWCEAGYYDECQALGCGVPVGAFLMTERVAEKSLAPGDHGTTYGGNPFVGAAVDKVLEMMERDHITEHVKKVAPYLEKKLDELVAKYDFLTERRGMGLMQVLSVKTGRPDCSKSIGGRTDRDHSRFECYFVLYRHLSLKKKMWMR